MLTAIDTPLVGSNPQTRNGRFGLAALRAKEHNFDSTQIKDKAVQLSFVAKLLSAIEETTCVRLDATPSRVFWSFSYV